MPYIQFITQHVTAKVAIKKEKKKKCQGITILRRFSNEMEITPRFVQFCGSNVK